MKVKSFEDLQVWQDSRTFVSEGLEYKNYKELKTVETVRML